MTEQASLEIGGSTMPRLSEELRHPPALNRCQNCGFVPEHCDWEKGSPVPDRLIDGTPVVVLERWQEHDEHDQPEGRVIVLCTPCSKRIIEPHPRLYRPLDAEEPFPGAHGICVGCVHRVTDGGLGCRAAKINGGEGLLLRGPKQSYFHACGRGKGGRRTSWSGWMWSGHVTHCSKRQEPRG